MKYKNYLRNYAIPAGREQALEDFLNQTYEGKKHKQQHKHNSNSEDALTWSCFEVLASFPFEKKLSVLREVFEDAFDGKEKPLFRCGDMKDDDLRIYAGKEYTGRSTGESTELDASIELPDALVFFEAKLYGAMSPATETTRDQIARKLRVGVDAPLGDDREFFFIFLDIAPLNTLKAMRKNHGSPNGGGFNDKWKSAQTFSDYRCGNGLREALGGLASAPPVEAVAANMGWLTWGNLFKSILRGMV